MQITAYHSWESLHTLRWSWNRLVERSPANEIFSRFEYLEAWSASRTRNAKLNVLVATDGREVTGIAPLMLSTRRPCGVPLTAIEFIGTPNSDYADFIYADSAVLDCIWKALADTPADLFYLDQVKATSPTCTFLNSLAGVIARPCTMAMSAILPEDPAAPVAAYIRGQGLRPRTLRRIDKEGAVRFDLYESAEEIKARLPILFDQHIRRWSDTPTPSFFEQNGFKELYRSWADALVPFVCLGVLTLNETPVASAFGFAYNRTFSLYTLTYDPEYRQFHCGLVCILKLMQMLRKRGIDRIDFTRGNEGFKSYFADIAEPSYEFICLRDLKARICMTAFLRAKDFAIAHESVKRVVRAFGFMPVGFDARRLGSADGNGQPDGVRRVHAG